MRVLMDYRPALRGRTGVGEYAHELARALMAAYGTADRAQTTPHETSALELTLFSSSWKDRLALAPELAGAVAIDRRVPVALLNLAWHRLGRPTAEQLTSREFDVTHSLHPLLLPSRSAAQVVTIHDLHFLDHPERTSAEIRRDYAALAQTHARRADGVIVVSQFTARQVEQRLEVPAERIAVCPPGGPGWTAREAPPADGGYVLFFGTLEPRKNVGGLLDAYELLLSRRRGMPPLVLAGTVTADARPWLERIARAPLEGVVRHIGYVAPSARRDLYAGALMLVQPSFEEGFGIPVVEAMTAGVPVVAANRGALPEVIDDAGPLVEPDDPESIAAAIGRLLDDQAYASAAVTKGVHRAAHFTWTHTAEAVYAAYQQAIAHRQCASA